MTIRIRPHHFLCMLTFLGKGYTAPFVRNYTHIVDRLNSGEELEIVDGPDDICRPMLAEADHHCHQESIRDRDDIASRRIHELLELDIEPGQKFSLTHAQIEALRDAYADGMFRTACAGCEWQTMCSSIAAKNYRGCRLEPGRKPSRR
ncbi:DUF1284 domain-containing protein [Roseibium sp.]|uniref:DUF1284 domain-containing protein n=1 Tax=Roseibium sp. TaxID=1936156 RepID=UPI003BAA3023